MQPRAAKNDDHDPGTLDLVSGLVGDIRELAGAHLSAARLEVRDELRDLVRAIQRAAIAAVAIGVAAMLIGTGLAMLLVEQVGLAGWASFGIVGLAFALVATGFALWARSAASDADGVPDREIQRTAHDARWIAKRARAAAQDPGTYAPDRIEH
jgi:uncharacterized membrane protein YqjE